MPFDRSVLEDSGGANWDNLFRIKLSAKKKPRTHAAKRNVYREDLHAIDQYILLLVIIQTEPATIVMTMTRPKIRVIKL